MKKIIKDRSIITTKVDEIFDVYSDLFNNSDPDRSKFSTLLSSIARLLNDFNVDTFPYEYSRVLRLQYTIVSEEAALKARALPEDVHYMGTSDSLPVLAKDVYGNVDSVTNIQLNNMVYSTDDALKKGIIKVVMDEPT
jgi:hypothetical protein